MFNVEKVGRRISELRKEKNMTQMELADRLGISYQAVSNWERGNSMPDIAKLPELAAIFEVTTDELLGESSELLKSAAKGELEKYVEQNNVKIEEFVEAAPALKPDQADAVAEELAVKKNLPDIKDILDLLPYISGEAIGEIARKEYEKNGMKNLESLARYMDEDDVAEIARQEYEKNGMKNLERLARYMDDDDLAEIAKREYEKNGMKNFERLAKYMDDDDLAEMAKREYVKNGMQDFESLVKYMDEDDVAEIAAMVVEKEGVKAIVPLGRYMDEDALSDIIKKKYV